MEEKHPNAVAREQMIKEAREAGKVFYFQYGGCWYTPDELEKGNKNGYYRFHPDDLTVYDPQEFYDRIDKKIADLEEEKKSFEERVKSLTSGNS